MAFDPPNPTPALCPLTLVPMKLDSAETTALDVLQDILGAERQLIENPLPEMVQAARSSEPKKAFRDHLAQTREQVRRPEEILGVLGEGAGDKKNAVMQRLIAGGRKTLGAGGQPEALDAALIAVQRKIERYEVAAYGVVLTPAETMGDRETITRLKETLVEEKAAGGRFARLAATHAKRRVAAR